MAPKLRAGWVVGRTPDIGKYYEFGHQIGEAGTTGYALSGIHKASGEKRAIKVIDKTVMNRDELVQLKEELKVMVSLNHKNIVKLHDVYENKTKLFLAMELCGGGELYERITRKGTYSEKDAALILIQVARGLKHMHERKIVHCDIKPDNILFLNEDTNSLKIIDFGASKFLIDGKNLTDKCGTPYYIAPEVIHGDYREHCDMWSLGVILFVMLFGFPPFDADDIDGELIVQQLDKGFTPETKEGQGPWFPANIPASDDAKDLISKLLLRDIARRMSPQEVLQHPWMRGSASSAPRLKFIFRDLRKFTATSRLREALLPLIRSSHLDDADRTYLKAQFKLLDINKDGRITYKVLAKHLKKELKLLNSKSEKQKHKLRVNIKGIIEYCDVDKDGAITFVELIQMAAQRAMIEKDERLAISFNRFSSRKESIGEMELHRVLSNFYGSKRYTLNDIKMMIKEWDFDNDGKLDFAEYKAMWKRKKIKKDKKKNSNNNPSNNNGGSGHENDNVAKSSVNRNSSVNRSGSANGKENMHTRTEGRNIAQRHASNAGPGLRHSNSNSSKSYSSNGNTFKKGAAEISMDEFLNAKPTKTEARGEEEENTYRKKADEILSRHHIGGGNDYDSSSNTNSNNKKNSRSIKKKGISNTNTATQLGIKLYSTKAKGKGKGKGKGKAKSPYASTGNGDGRSTSNDNSGYLRIEATKKGFAAAKAGLVEGDEIWKVNGRVLETKADLREVSQSFTQGGRALFLIRRQGVLKAVSVYF